MDCEAAKKLMSRHLDGELSPGDRAMLEAHLAQCFACQAEHAAQERLWTLLLRVEPVQVPNLIGAIEEQISERRGWTSRFASIRLRTLSYAAAAALLVGGFVWGGIWAGTQSMAGGHDRVVAELLTDAPPGMEIVTLLDEIGDRP